MTTGSSAGPARVPALGRQAAQEVARELTAATAAARTGDLHVSGDPGGRLRIVGGRVVAVCTTGAPSVTELLARPGRKLPGEAERRALEVIAVLDAAFAIASGWIDGCYWTSDIDPPLDADTAGRLAGVEADRLTTETERRLRALANSRVSPHRNRLARTESGDTLLRDCPAGQRREILLQVDGKHRCRDIAFALGRGLYPVTVEVSRLLAEHALVVPSGANGRPLVSPVPGALPRVPLPRRRRNASGINELYPPRAQELPAPTGSE
ncbi:hypothetical protein [Nocardia blacklockiae]|uniref:hypothetical protein n=1 Tax=Nocardia blacklockiae TaxID=480036 RepID=UPI001892E802|nr:hypothetical protein [Nocardia blacklockiae]MBF6174429.1 hypothetical protein [Nocardia blacklockiae]